MTKIPKQRDIVLDMLESGQVKSTIDFIDGRNRWGAHILRVTNVIGRLKEEGYKIENLAKDRSVAQYVWHLDCPKRQGGAHNGATGSEEDKREEARPEEVTGDDLEDQDDQPSQEANDQPVQQELL